ncbi:hypothetical protein COB21_05940 [Candidatus Aerophobetes bacterium]|uniref:Uncharacterized protein n=1 Tax=Aerophobetes bacterium TaxID=2030807 RepID=A0A2A4WZC8_UNCAE|nr:MAG: hypothetical protein COB21_05940 [Candidatus Aerophobetes bacterium]
METDFSARFAAFVPVKTSQAIKRKVPPFPKEKTQANNKQKTQNNSKQQKKDSLLDLMRNGDEKLAATTAHTALTNRIDATVKQEQAIAVSQVSEQVSDLINSMSDVIMIEKNNGISRCEIELTNFKQDSCFKGGILTFDHYDTAPHSFNISLNVHTEKAVTLFNASLAPLQAHLETLFPSFKFNLSEASFTTVGKQNPQSKAKKPLFAKTLNKASHSDNS